MQTFHPSHFTKNMMQENNSFWDGGSKTMFFTGLFLGIALAATVGGGYAFSTLVSGRGLGGSTAVVAAAPNAAPTAQPSAQPSAGPVKPVDDKVDHIRGPANAKVTLIEYSDFQCPFCERHEPTMTQILQQYPKDVRLVYRHYPLTQLHPNAQPSRAATTRSGKRMTICSPISRRWARIFLRRWPAN